ncbi:hypothetical protein K4105_05690, partial [Buchnera aphidicola]|nr:hypothetical protein [Buchnera aphidicola]
KRKKQLRTWLSFALFYAISYQTSFTKKKNIYFFIILKNIYLFSYKKINFIIFFTEKIKDET